MWGVEIDPEQPFVYSVFGIQYTEDTPNTTQQARIDEFNSLITPSAAYIENLVQDNSDSGPKTRIWLAYWKSVSSYKAWWENSTTASFWTSLPPDAGMWREILTISSGRTQMGLSSEKPEGMAHIGTITPNTSKTGYWGCYRDRYADASKTNRLSSSLPEPPSPQPSTNNIRPGRVLMRHFPENLCFVIEGQDHSAISEEEKQHWFTNFDTSVTNWIHDLNTASPSSGILSSRLCFSPTSGKYRHATPEALNYNRKVQLFWFLDHGYMEKIGKSNKGHVALRSNFLGAYCPTGAMGKIARLVLWVETSVLGKEELECEYVGCVEGTGFLAFDGTEAFRSESQGPTAGWMGALKGLVPWGS
ncbi:hypothetical protein EG329_008751 [Mollisiaceae sp. DMI_Dod_QoI]|nr:hypothetical protein EG329_008751 [Helotiales sp. DMI_Dod_QoI]